MNNSSFSVKLSAAVLAFLVFVRGACLEVGELVDPTESRYAAVAQHMFLSTNWLTPMLPGEEGLEPYFGKPPLHFWLTAFSYKLFGVEEWTSRLPSFLLALGCLLLTYSLSRKLRDSSKQEAIFAALISLISPLFFLFAGASTVDVTLAFFVLLGFVSFAHWADSEKTRKPQAWAVLGAAALALGFLTKGPLALVLVAGGLLPWLVFTRRLSLLREIPWILVLLVFTAITAPWFLISEKVHPGFLRYYVWNEHIARYLVSDYGDRYGSGHVYPRGTVWVMLFVALFPWGFTLCEALIRKDLRSRFVALCREDQWLLFALFAGLAPAFFFTLARQLHTAYVLPGIPLLSVVIARLIVKLSNDLNRTYFTSLHFGAIASLGLCGAAVLATPWLGASWSSLATAALILLGGLLVAGHLVKFPIPRTFRTAALLGTFLLMLLPLSSEILDERKSTEGILRAALRGIEQSNPDIGIAHSNVYSPFWLSKAWPQELGEPVTVSFVDITNFQRSLPANLLLRKPNPQQTQTLKDRGYAEKLRSGRWFWYAREH